MSARVAVVGVGAIGGVVAAELLAAGAQVTLCARTPLDRLVVEREEHPRDLGVSALTDPTQAEPTEFAVVALKAQDSAHAAPWLARLAVPETTIVVIQNGVEHDERLAPHAVVPAIINTAVERVAPGRLKHGAGDTLTLADRPGARAFAALLDGSVIKAVLEPDFTTAAWRKLFSNLAGNPLTAITGRRSEVLQVPEARELALRVLEEALPVARAEGARLTDEDPRRTVEMLTALPPDVGSSMLYDRLNGRPLEIDPLVGAVVRAGRRHALPTPRAETLYALLSAL
ncbi:2-dehydropantoate 2-reductase [Solirubrobacter sp. CPCC 204708]|uniref:2-dehydropantoate 2-reductase n=1 Tax=Solirubrobacter deserti TaxID=2282478 RepID=A0ABT4REI5_9ACTN|nr:2-dehydropantoate 2-reductase [Solirubrobacter deserti]MBE2318496.1 2-dehydropantoate 2-reductase [Solirubrobacter deserti]MDA0136954.1 2-dehydropantoate 2-reductase [Solirubrobacter deserti]